MITATDTYDVVFSNYDKIIEKKKNNKRFTNKAIEHGLYYEDIAKKIYEKKYKRYPI